MTISSTDLDTLIAELKDWIRGDDTQIVLNAIKALTDLRTERDALSQYTPSLGAVVAEVRDRLTSQGYADSDRIRIALLHLETVEKGKAASALADRDARIWDEGSETTGEWYSGNSNGRDTPFPENPYRAVSRRREASPQPHDSGASA